jgi:ketosteroid isomerase-like protein
MKTSRLASVISIGLVIIISVSACKNKEVLDKSKELAETDRHYSDLSAEKGMNTAFLAMFDTSGVLLRANHDPIVGIEAIRKLLLSQNDSTFELTWEPEFAKMASSGDLGYTFGKYKFIDKATDSVSGEGTYCTVWQKQDDGSWKAILDTGNPGLGRKK